MSEDSPRGDREFAQADGSRPFGASRLSSLSRGTETPRYDLSHLERETGISGRTIRYYITEGLLPPAHGRGPGATYDQGHLLRLKLIGILKSEHLPLQEIRRRLGDLSDQEISLLLEVQTQPSEQYWRRIELHPDIELHVRQRHGESQEIERAVDLIVGLVRPVIERIGSGD